MASVAQAHLKMQALTLQAYSSARLGVRIWLARLRGTDYFGKRRRGGDEVC